MSGRAADESCCGSTVSLFEDLWRAGEIAEIARQDCRTGFGRSECRMFVVLVVEAYRRTGVVSLRQSLERARRAARDGTGDAIGEIIEQTLRMN